MEREDEHPIDREPWRRRLAALDDGPPRETDEHVRALARRAAAPPRPRWLLPASLAASLLLAVVLVRWQYEEGAIPGAVTEFDQAAPPENATEPAADPGAAPEPDAFAPGVGTPVPPPPPVRPAAPPMVPPPAVDLPETEAPRSRAPAPAARPAQDARDAGSLSVTGRREAEAAESAAIGAAVREIRADESVERTPEAWYAEIEALRAAGRHEEAKAELARLEQAHPGWLERHRAEER